MINNKVLLLKKKLEIFYKNKEHAQKFLDVIEKNTEYSLRVVEWMVTNYSKKNNIVYSVGGRDFNVYLSYKAHLDGYNKKQFDPFRRKHKGLVKFPLKLMGTTTKEPITIETTVGQLNFFKWCISNKIFDYIQKHIREIKEDMNKNISGGKNKKKEPQKKKTSSTTRTLVKRYNKVIIDFD